MPRRTRPRGSKQARKRVIPKVRRYRLPRIKKAVLAAIPDNWLDSILTGNRSALQTKPWGCREIESILNAVRARIEALPELNC